MLRKLTNITPIDEYIDDMTKEELYDDYFKLYQEYVLCLEQFDDLGFALKTAKKTRETIKIRQVLELLDHFLKERCELIDEHTRDDSQVIVCE